MDDDGHLWQSFLLGRGDTSAQRNQRAGGSLGMDQTHWTAISFFFNPTNDHTRILTQNLYTYIYIYIKYIYILTQTCTSMYISWIHSTFIHSHPGAECDYFKTSAQNFKKI